MTNYRNSLRNNAACAALFVLAAGGQQCESESKRGSADARGIVALHGECTGLHVSRNRDLLARRRVRGSESDCLAARRYDKDRTAARGVYRPSLFAVFSLPN